MKGRPYPVAPSYVGAVILGAAIVAALFLTFGASIMFESNPVACIGALLAVCALVGIALCGFRLPSLPRVDGYANEWAAKRGKRERR